MSSWGRTARTKRGRGGGGSIGENRAPLMGVHRVSCCVGVWWLSCWLVSTVSPWSWDSYRKIVPRPVGEGCL